MLAGIDKLQLFTNDFQVKDSRNTGMQLQEYPIDLSTGERQNESLYRDSLGNTINGRKCYDNNHPDYSIDINQHGLSITFNPSKMSHEYELLTDTKQLIENCKNVVADVQKGRGILFDENTIRLTRNDVTKDIQSNLPTSEYAPLFASLKGKRHKSQTQYPSGYLTGNKSNALICYDRWERLKGLNKNFQQPTEGNRLRAEIQYRKKSNIVSNFGFNSLPMLYEAGIEGCTEVYNKSIKENIFRVKELEPENAVPFGYETMLAYAQTLKDEGRKGIVNHLKNLAGSPLSISTIENILYGIGCDRRTVERNLAKERELLQKRSFLFNRTSQQIIESQYEELYTKLTA